MIAASINTAHRMIVLSMPEPMKKRRGDSSNWPMFDSPLLRDIANAFQKRRKTLRYRAGLVCGHEWTETEDGSSERLNLDCRGGHVRLSVWEDGAMWLGVSIPAEGRRRGWAFQDAFHGDVRDVSPAALVGMLETTLELPVGDDMVTGRLRLREVWRRVRPTSP